MNYRYIGNFRFAWCDRVIFNPHETFIKTLDYKPALAHWADILKVKLNKLEGIKDFEVEVFEKRFKTMALILCSRQPYLDYVRAVPEKPNSLWLEAHYVDGFRITVMDYFKEDEVVEVDYRDTSDLKPVFKGRLCLTDLDTLLNDTTELNNYA